MASCPFAASAGTFPDRPIRLVVPSAPGGVFDGVARIWAEKARVRLGTVVIENQAGTGRAEAYVARAQPDGYTILVGGLISNVLYAVAVSKPQYDAMSFEPISILGTNSYGFAVTPSLQVRNLQELLDYQKQHPVSYGSPRVGSLNHLTGELFKYTAKASEISHVPYRGAGPALTDLVSGQIPLAVVSLTTQVLDLHHSGKIRIIAVTSPQRLRLAPDIPTTTEQGFAAVDSQNYLGLFAPPKTPPDEVETLAQASRDAIADQAYRDSLTAAGFDAFPDSSPGRMKQVNQQLFATWSPIIKAIGLKLD
jgi:tripartite-type tricarboxylate transporter receptor subunit TctC